MLNRFKNALYGTSSSTDDSSIGSVYTDYKEAVFGRRIRGALTRSSSFREDLLSEVSRSRLDDNDREIENNGIGGGGGGGGLHRGRSQLLRKPPTTIHESDEQYSSSGNNHTNQPGSSNTRLASTTSKTNNRLASQRGPGGSQANSNGPMKVHKFRYTRPEFLQLKTDDEIIVSADHQIRPIILPRDVSRLPWKSGYAECINAGKSATNEDQAACYQDVALRRAADLDQTNNILDQIPWTYFGLFDGHAGSAVAVAAAAQLHTIISEKIRHAADLLIALEFDLAEEAAQEEEQLSPPLPDDELCEPDLLSDDEELDVSNSTDDDDEFQYCQSSPMMSRRPSGGQAGALESATELQSPVESSGVGDVEDAASEGQQAEPQPGSSLSSSTRDETFNSKTSNSQSKSTSAASNGVQAAAASSTHSSAGQAHSRPEHPPPKFELRQRRRTQYIPNDTYLPSILDIHRNNITVESLIKGALESAFWEMDELIACDKLDYRMPGGCAAIVALFIMGQLYVCNAGDCRAIVCRNKRVIPMSHDFTPVSERQRILRLGMERPDLLGKEFTHLEFLRRPTRKDLGKYMYYRDAYMTGWSLKEITYDDLKFPLVWGEGKRSRVLATIGVTRGFGDHELRAQYGSVMIKPFLTPEPDVRVLDLEDKERPEEESGELTGQDVLIMGTDGLWDVATNAEVAEIVERSLRPDNELSRSKYRYISAAQDLIIHSRGTHSDDYNNNAWRMSTTTTTTSGARDNNNRFASLDDISAFVIPLKAYRDEYLEWKRSRQEMVESNRRRRERKRRQRTSAAAKRRAAACQQPTTTTTTGGGDGDE